MNGVQSIAERVIKELKLNERYPSTSIQPIKIVWCYIMETFTYIYSDHSYIVNDNYKKLYWGIQDPELKLDSGHNGD